MIVYFRVIRLENGLVACLISDLTNPEAVVSSLDDDDDDVGESDCEGSGSESEFETEESESGSTEEGDSDEDETVGRKKTVETEEKMVLSSANGLLYFSYLH